MAVRSILRSIVAMAALAASCVNVSANSVNLSYLEGLTPVAPDAITALGTDLFGDKVNLFNGVLSFEHTDLNLPGNSRLPVALGRSHVPGRLDDVRGQFGDWDLEAPRITGTFATGVGWVSSAGGGRCSSFNLPPSVAAGASVAFIATDYWSGTFLRVPGAGEQEILRRAPGYTAQPTDNNTYPLVTRDNWQLRCLPELINAPGEGFAAVSPEGVTYYFNWMATRAQTGVKKSGAGLARTDYFLMATLVTDRFNNWVRYTYDPSNPLLLKTIESKDGRVISIANAQGRAVSATDGTRTFSYGYSGLGHLTSVRQPDGSQWTFELASMVPPLYQTLGEGATCDNPGDFPGDVLTGRIIHPSGAVGTFTTEFLLLGRSMVTRTCKWIGSPTFTVGAVWPRLFITQGLTRKEISGPGMPNMVWTYGIGSPWSWSTCTDCPTTRTVLVSHPNGSVSRHIFGTRWRVDEGQLLSVEDGWTSTGALRRTDFRYRVHTTAERFPDQFGISLLRNSDWLSSRNRPLDRRVITQQSTQFIWEVADVGIGFDHFARPETVRKYSSLGFSRSELQKYFDHRSSWTLGQTESITETVGRRVIEENVYDSTFGLAIERREFGRVIARFGYHDDGNLRNITDPAGRVTTLEGYRRGRPQQVSFADGNVERQAINNLGLVDSHTNAANTTTTYGYDLMGRVRTIQYPGGDPVAYHVTNQEFAQVQGNEYGLTPGYWRQTIVTGQSALIRYFDGLWRPRVEVKYDRRDAGNTASFKEFRYDGAGNKSFESYPERNFSTVNVQRPGVASYFDAINRISRQDADSELGGLLRAITQYPANAFQTIVTNPRGFSATHAFQAFDSPDEQQIASVWAPEGVTLSISRDVFGKPLAITRAGGGLSATRRYVYDLHQRLCKRIEPETAATIMFYDLAGNLEWSASGVQAPSETTCDHMAVPSGRKVSYRYDDRNRPILTTYGDGSSPVTKSYTRDGKLASSSTPQWGWTYTYNNRRLLATETFVADGTNFVSTYHHNEHGHVARMDYWGGHNIDYAPNALGQPTKVGAYVSDVLWHPNGAVASYVLGNGIRHTTIQNTRGLPAIMSDAGIVHDEYAYDANGNVSQIIDKQGGDANNSRTMQYDQLDRLTIANGPWGLGSFGYDALDNLRSSRVGSRSLFHYVDPASNRLQSIGGSLFLGMGYDASGNIIQRGTQRYVFDVGNRMSSAVGKAEYVHDGAGRRARSFNSDGSVAGYAYTLDGKLRIGGHTVHGNTWFFYLGDRVVAEFNDLSGIHYVHTDSLGSPVARTNAARQVISRTIYEPYGSVANGTIPSGTFTSFTGHLTDSNTGLVYMQQRYYDPITGRFLSVDPVTTDAKTGDSFNRYIYGNNNPYKFKDPDGRFAQVAAAGAGVLLVGAAICDSCRQSLANGVAGVGPAIGRMFSQGQRPSKTPNTGPPGSTHVNPGSGQERTYGPDGKPLVDVDRDHDHGQGVPHKHDWADGKRGPGQPMNPLAPSPAPGAPTPAPDPAPAPGGGAGTGTPPPPPPPPPKLEPTR